jgi:hypothetical protein
MFHALRPALVAAFRGPRVRRGVLVLCLGVALSALFALFTAVERTREATARLSSAAARLDDLTDGGPADDARRAAIAWGYAERLRLGLESPFRLVESAARDPRFAAEERRTVSWALLAHLVRGQSHQVDPATLDGIGPAPQRRPVSGERHLALISRAVSAASNPRAGELGVRLAYTLAAAERLVDGSAPALAAGVASLVADRELARREAEALVRGASDPIAELRDRRARRAMYVERPALLEGNDRLDRAGVEISRWVLDSLRTFIALRTDEVAQAPDEASAHAAQLLVAGRTMPPAAPLVVTVKRYVPLIRAHARGTDLQTVVQATNPEMLAAAASMAWSEPLTRAERRVLGRLLVSSAVAMRSHAQQPVWFPGDSAPAATDLAAALGVAGISFDADVPIAWRPYFLLQLADGVGNLRRVLPALRLDATQVRFRMSPPADSALAMHDPRTRTLHLPVLTAEGTLAHELAHELDRQSAVSRGHAGYRSDYVARNAVRERSRTSSSSVSASLRALTTDFGDAPRASSSERPAEIFATQVDWFVAKALATQGRTSGFLTGVQDELLTGHVVHPERLRTSARGRPLVDALRGMTGVAPFASVEQAPSMQTLLRWALSGPVDREAAARIVGDHGPAWSVPALETAESACGDAPDHRAQLVRMAAESRARGWLGMRAHWADERERAPWALALVGQAPWSETGASRRIAQLREHVLLELSSSVLLPSGLTAHGAPVAAAARCNL